MAEAAEKTLPIREHMEAARREAAPAAGPGSLARTAQLVRARARSDEIVLLLLAGAVGMLAGLAVVAISSASEWMHVLLYNLPPGARLSAQTDISWQRALPILTVGGLLMGLGASLSTKWSPRRAVDPIEANALYGGRMSLADSAIVVAQTLLSNGVGASVGLEAGYTQAGGALASRIGRAMRLRRADLRLLTGCGAAGAIAAAFDGPLTGAFYSFELVVGVYTLATLAPVVAAAITAYSVKRALLGIDPVLNIGFTGGIGFVHVLPVATLGVLAGLIGIALMRGVTTTEAAFRASRVPGWARPAIGGAAVAGLSTVTPALLASGHGALYHVLLTPVPVSALAGLLVFKALASAVSIGSGFRGGLFFASLLLGALAGKLFSQALSLAGAPALFPEAVYGVIGMSALAVAVIGGPMTMTFLALENTESLPLTAAVLGAAAVSSITVRRLFGYSFATWRFHLRGESIRSAVDIGWMRDLTVGRLMRRDIRTVRSDMTVAEFRHAFPLGSMNRVVALDEADRYAGIVWLSDVHAADTEAVRIGELLHARNAMLRPEMTAREAAEMFEAAEADALAVVDNADGRRVLGLLTEAHTLRRYAEELEKRRRDLSGE